jgi:hypothetical protein
MKLSSVEVDFDTHVGRRGHSRCDRRRNGRGAGNDSCVCRFFGFAYTSKEEKGASGYPEANVLEKSSIHFNHPFL